MPPAFAATISVSDLSKSFGSEQIFADVSFQVAEREHAALVGINGAGKSTLLRIVAGDDVPSAGTVARPPGCRVTYLPQEARFDSDRTVREEARLAFTEALAAAERMREIEQRMADAGADELDALLHEYDRLHARFESGGGYDVEHRTDQVLAGLGFSGEQVDQPVNRLSGGQKTRVALAKALLADPDLLLLDEPTNHLDLEMLEWLEGFLRSWSGACLVVSHDRYFLDRVTTRTLDLSFGRLEDYPAPYARYLVLRKERLARRQQEYEEQQEYIARTEEFIRRYKAGQRAREAKGRQTRLDRLERIERPQEYEGLKLRVNAPVRSGRDVVSLSPLRVGYPSTGGGAGGGAGGGNGGAFGGPRELVATPELRIERGDRIGLIGPNGSGKSTLLKTLVGEIPPLKGRVTFGTNVKVGYYAQGHEGLPMSGTPLSVILDAQPIGEEAARNYLGRFLFSDDDVYKEIAALSGGERSRLALALLVLQQANLLILDEPTNHLDIQTRETLEVLLADFEGTILFVSHDRFFIDRIATRIWAIEDGQVQTALGNYTDYQRKLGRRGEPAPASKPAPDAAAATSAALPVKQADKRVRADGDGRAAKGLLQAEREVARLEGKLIEIGDALTVAGIDGDTAAIARLGAEYQRAQDDLDAAYERWEELTTPSPALAAAPA